MTEAPRQGLRRCVILAALSLLSGVALAPSAPAREVFVANGGASSVSVIDSGSGQVLGEPIPVGLGPFGIAFTPDGRRAYVTNIDIGLVKAVDAQSRQVVGPAIEVGGGPYGIAITPDGSRAYVATGSPGAVAVIDTQTNFVGPAISVGADPEGVAIAPNGHSAYATSYTSSNVSAIDLQSGQAVGPPIPVGANPVGIAITPDGKTAYVANTQSSSVSVIDTGTNQVVGPPIGVGAQPRAIAITPDGGSAYVANTDSGSVSVIDTQANQVVGTAIPVGKEPKAIAITPDGRSAYVANHESDDVSVIDTRTNQVVGSPILVGNAPEAIAIAPDQSPIASFTVPLARPGVATSFDASASSDPDGSIDRFDWDFGDGGTAPDGGPTPRHSYARPGEYQTTLTVTDSEGCSTSLVFTGQTATCNGSTRAQLARTVTVAFPAIRLACPKRAGRSGCRFKLRAVTKLRRGKAETKVARARVRTGRSKIVPLRPKPRFASRLAVAKKVLIRGTVRIGGASKRYVRRLNVVG